MTKSRWSLVAQATFLPLLALLVLTLSAGTAHAQSFFGSIVGTVTDASGAILPDAVVTITNVATNEKKTVHSSASGDFSFVSLLPSSYTVEVTKASFKRFLREQVTVQVNMTIRVDAAMQIGEATETVEVNTEAPLLQTDSGTMGTVIEGKTVDEMPLNGRNTMNLLALTPGVVPASGAYGGAALGTGGRTTASNWGGYSIGGGLIGQGSMYLDGAPMVVLGGGASQAQMGFVPVQDAIQEFNVASSAATAEYGRYSGGVVNMTTKSGSNSIHFTAYEYLRNRVLNANEWFTKRSQLSKGQANKPAQWNQNQYGVQGSAPIIKDKLFFMGAWEVFTARISSLQNRTVPTTNMQNGLIEGNITAASQALGSGNWTLLGACPTATYDASTGYTTLPAACWDPAATLMKTEWPAATATSGAASNINFQKLSGAGSDNSNVYGRADWNLNANQRLFVRFTRNILTDSSQEWMPGGARPSAFGGGVWHIGGGTTTNRAYQGVIGDTWTVNPTTIVDARLSVMRVYLGELPPTAGMDLSGFGTNWAKLNGQMSHTNLPTMSFNGSAKCATSNPYCGTTSFANAGQMSYQWNDNSALVFSLTKITGSHTLKMGGETRFMDRYKITQNGGAMSGGGNFNFDTTYFAKNQWANFLLGLPQSSYQTNVREVGSVNIYQGYYANDTWQVNRKLTLIAGLRWELPGALIEKKDNAQVLAPATFFTSTTTGTSIYGTAQLVNSTNYKDRSVMPARHDLFMPNVGFAYRLTDQDVIRGGWSMTVAPLDIQTGMFPENISMNSFSNSFNFASSLAIQQLSNPFPSGLSNPISRTSFNPSAYLKGSITAPVPTTKFPYTQQWNLSVSHQFKGDLMVQIGYAGSVAKALPMTFSFNQLPAQYWNDPLLATKVTSASAPSTTVTAAQIASCTAVWGTSTYGQCARPYSAYQSITDAVGPTGTVNYQSMPVIVTKRFKNGSLLNAHYTWAKVLGNTGSGTGPGTPTGLVQDWYNLKAERSTVTYSLPRRFVASYVANLPFGKGQLFLNSISNPILSRMVNGWAINGIVTLQSGTPLPVAATTSGNLLVNYGLGTLRPNYNSGCPKMAGGSWKDHVLTATSVLNNSCWTLPSSTAVGNAPRVDGDVRAPGYNNWDLSFQKKTAVTEKTNIEFRAEFFNVWNHVRFNLPNITVGSSSFGLITSSGNLPRLGQLSLRFNF